MRISHILSRTLATLAIGLGASLILAGCSTGLSPSTNEPTPTPHRVLNGSVHGGQQGVSGSTIQLYAVGTGGIASAATPLISATVLSDQNGFFTITGDWDCTSNTAIYGPNPLLYIVATGGNPGLGGSVNNTGIALMTAIGPCNTFTPSSFVTLNELTTIAAVYALAPFMADRTHVGATGPNAPGLVHAFQIASSLVDPSLGTIPGPNLPSNATLPQAEIISLADIVASCINSTGTTGGCPNLFLAATPPAGTAPTETIAAALDIAKFPGNNVSTLFTLALPSAPFQNGLPTPPNDWTIALNFTGGGILSPAGIALDANGNAWVANAGGSSVTELSPTGALLTGTAGYSGSGNILGAQAVAVDTAGNIWLADTLLSSIVELKLTAGVIQSSATYTSGGINGPIALAIDSQNNVWISNDSGASVTELNSSGTPLGASPLTANSTLQTPIGIAVDRSGNAWVTDNTSLLITEFAPNQTLLSGAGYTDGSILAPQGIAFDPQGRVWIANAGTNDVSLFTPTGSPLPGSPISGGGLSLPTAIAADSAGSLWVVNSLPNGSLSQLAFGHATPLSPATGFGLLNAPAAIAVDASGSVWTANAGDNSISLFIGLAAPTTTPLAANAGP